MTKTFPANVIAGLYTGISLGPFEDIHEAAEHLMGHPIWTHEFAVKGLWEAMRKKLEALFPTITKCDELVKDVSKENWESKRDAITATWPEGFTFEAGTEERTEDPISSLQRIAPGKEVIVVQVDK